MEFCFAKLQGQKSPGRAIFGRAKDRSGNTCVPRAGAAHKIGADSLVSGVLEKRRKCAPNRLFMIRCEGSISKNLLVANRRFEGEPWGGTKGMDGESDTL
jgi:hypothetical protein